MIAVAPVITFYTVKAKEKYKVLCLSSEEETLSYKIKFLFRSPWLELGYTIIPKSTTSTEKWFYLSGVPAIVILTLELCSTSLNKLL